MEKNNSNEVEKLAFDNWAKYNPDGKDREETFLDGFEIGYKESEDKGFYAGMNYSTIEDKVKIDSLIEENKKLREALTVIWDSQLEAAGGNTKTYVNKVLSIVGRAIKK